MAGIDTMLSPGLLPTAPLTPRMFVQQEVLLHHLGGRRVDGQTPHAPARSAHQD